MRLMNMAHLFLAIALAGCTAVSKKECEAIDWHKQGYDTAFLQKDREAVLNQYRQTCGQEHNVQPNLAQFEAGFKEGHSFLCSRDGGYEFGRIGGVYARSCAKDKEADFFVGYQRGQLVHTAARMKALEGQVTSARIENDGKQRRIDLHEAKQRELRSQLGKTENQTQL